MFWAHLAAQAPTELSVPLLQRDLANKALGAVWGGRWAGYLIWGLGQVGGCSRITVEGASRKLFRAVPASSEEREGCVFSFVLGKLRRE